MEKNTKTRRIHMEDYLNKGKPDNREAYMRKEKKFNPDVYDPDIESNDERK